LSTSSRPALGPGSVGSFPGGKAIGGVKLTIYLQLVPRLKNCGSIHPLSDTP
jgi:hypothetical protein